MADTEKLVFGPTFSLPLWLAVQKAFLKRVAEVAIEEVEREWPGERTPNVLDQMFISAYTAELYARFCDACKVPAVSRVARNQDELNDGLRLAAT